MRKWLALILPLLLFLPFSVQAQNNITIDSLKVSLWSEYDQPSMLVLYDLKFPAGMSLPTSVKLRVPKDANITAVAYQKGSGWLNAEFAGPTTDGNWLSLTLFVKKQTTYRLEYYQPLRHEGSTRSFTYQWTGEYPVKNLRVELQLPEDSTAVKSTPTIPFTPTQSFLSGSASMSNLKHDQIYQLELSYERATDTTALPTTAPDVTVSDPISQNTTGRVTLNNLPYILGGVGALLIAGAFYYFWRSDSIKQTGWSRRRSQPAAQENTVIYCHECGARAQGEDRFCRVCGTKLRNSGA